MIKILTNNIGLKILSIIFAAALWLVVVNIEDPEITRSFLVSVSIENADVIEDAGKVYEVLEDTDSVRVTVTAKRKTMDKLSASDFQAVADFKDLEDDELEGIQELQIYITTVRYSSQVSISSRVKYLKVNIEDEEEIEVEVTPSYSGTLAEGYRVGKITAEPESITVSGPETVISKIAYAQANVDVTELATSTIISADVLLYDETGQTIGTDRLSLSQDSVRISVVLAQQKSVALSFRAEGSPASGYEVVNIQGNVSTVNVLGAEEDIENLEYISISGSVLNVEGESATVTKTVKLADFLPDGVSLADGEPEEVTVTITIEPYEEKTFTIDTADIDVNGLSGGYECSFSQSSVSVKVTAAEAATCPTMQIV